MIVTYLETPIAKAKRTDTPRYGIAHDGYTYRSGAPTDIMVKLQGERIWRRLMFWCFSNAGTAFLRIKGLPIVIRGSDEHEIQRLIAIS